VSTLELIWQHGAPYAIARSDDGVLTDDGLAVGSRTEIHVAGSHAVARRLTVAELIDLDPDATLGTTARAVLALRDLARRTVADGLVHPQLTKGGTTWYAFWGATLDEGLQAELDAIVAAAPPAAGELDELYPQLVDQIARDKPFAAEVRLAGPSQLGRSPALEGVLRAPPRPTRTFRTGPTYATLERRLSRWVDLGLRRSAETRWQLGLHPRRASRP
jgi:hypothetical protein